MSPRRQSNLNPASSTPRLPTSPRQPQDRHARHRDVGLLRLQRNFFQFQIRGVGRRLKFFDFRREFRLEFRAPFAKHVGVLLGDRHVPLLGGDFSGVANRRCGLADVRRRSQLATEHRSQHAGADVEDRGHSLLLSLGLFLFDFLLGPADLVLQRLQLRGVLGTQFLDLQVPLLAEPLTEPGAEIGLALVDGADLLERLALPDLQAGVCDRDGP